MDVTGGAGTGTPALRLDPGNAVLDCGLHDGRTDFALDRARGAFVIDVGDARHVIGRELLREVRRCRAPIAAGEGARQMSAGSNRRSQNQSGAEAADIPASRCTARQSVRVTATQLPK